MDVDLAFARHSAASLCGSSVGGHEAAPGHEPKKIASPKGFRG
jgi:hypothetical protein